MSSTNLPKPGLVVHADWSLNPAKRWLAAGRLDTSGGYVVDRLERVGDTVSLFKRLSDLAGGSNCILAGFDFPIGLPIAYAQKCGISNFIGFLSSKINGIWPEFFSVAELPSEISLQRPFYPRRPGSARQRHLLEALGFEEINQIRRACELGSTKRRPACPLFWTMGSQQVGKAAISGWREVLIPALMQTRIQSRVMIWPFHGSLSDLIRPGTIVVAEAYPAEFYTHLGIDLRLTEDSGAVPISPGTQRKTGKRSQSSRKANSGRMLKWAEEHQILVSRRLRNHISDGFGSNASAEDQFDALVGLFGMLNIIEGDRPPGDPEKAIFSTIEGWILGQMEE